MTNGTVIDDDRITFSGRDNCQMIIERKHTRRINIGDVPVGDGATISVQSMTNTDTRDVQATVRQIKRLEKAGCEIVR